MSNGLWPSLCTHGLAANRPTTPSNRPAGTFVLYYATDTQTLSLYDAVAVAWVTLGAPALTSIQRNANLAAAGSTVTDAAQLLPGFTVVTDADATKGVKLPATPVAGTVVIVKNVDVANAVLKVWPDAAATINAIGSNSDLAMAAKTSAIFVADSTTQWYTVPLLPS